MKRLIPFICSLFFVPNIHGAITVLSNTATGSTGGLNVTTSGIDSTGGSLIVMAVCDYSIVSAATISDNKTGNVWQSTGSFSAASSIRERILYSTGSASGFGSSHTFTATCGGGLCYPVIAVAVFSGTTQTNPLDKSTGNSASGVLSIFPGSLTPTNNDSLVVSGLGFDVSNTVVVTGMSILNQIDYLAANHFGCGFAYAIQTTATASNPEWSWGASGAGAATSHAVFKVSTPAASTTSDVLGLMGLGG